MKKYNLLKIMTLVAIALAAVSQSAFADTTRAERKAIDRGNKLYKEGKYTEAAKEYQLALKDNPSSAVAAYNLGLTEVRRGAAARTDSIKAAFLNAAMKSFSGVARLGAEKPDLAARANYNLGNMAFEKEEYAQAISSYKESLRLNPDDANARRNLRIAQLKLKQQDQNKDQQDQNKQDQNKDQNDQNKQDQDQNKDQQQNQDQQKQQPKDPEINQQTADQILKAMENKENEIRARVLKAGNGEKASGAASRSKKW